MLTMNTDIFILARSTSKRLPSKHMKIINGKSIIENLVDRMKKSNKIRKIVVCTTILASDDKLSEILQKKNIECFRGSDKDIIERLLDAAKFYDTDIIIDVSGDKIYTDTDYVDKVAEILQNQDIDFVRGSRSKSKFDPGDHFIHGIIPGGFKTKTLRKICQLKKTENTEDGYTEFFTSSEWVKKQLLVPDIDINKTEKIKLDLDYPDDLKLAEIIFEKLGNDFHVQDILKLLEKNPQLVKINEVDIDNWRENYAKLKTDFSLKQ